jgi:hypothetical protein
MYRSRVGATDARWGLNEQLLAAMFDALQISNWQRGNGKLRDRPKPIPRPGIAPTHTVIGETAVPMEEMDAWLGWNTPEVAALDAAMDQLDNDGGVTDD